MMSSSKSLLDMELLAIIFFFFVLILIFFYWKLPSSGGQAERFEATITLISSIAATLTLVVAAWQLHKYRSEQTEHQQQVFVTTTNEYFSKLEQLFVDQYPYLDKFYRELYGENIAPNLAKIPIPNNVDPAKDDTLTIHVCLMMLQDIENVILSIGEEADWCTPLNQEWLRTWRIWFSSPTLREQYDLKKDLFSLTTQQFLEKNVFPYIHKK